MRAINWGFATELQSEHEFGFCEIRLWADLQYFCGIDFLWGFGVMTNFRTIVLAIAIIAVGFGSAVAQSDFFFSFDQGGPNADQSATFNVGDTGSLWIYWSTNGPADSSLNVGAFIDLLSSNTGVIEFTQAETFDYDITVGGVDIGNRWLDDNGGGGSIGQTADSITADFIDELHAFTVQNSGIEETNNGSGVFLDTGYTASNDGFEFGRIDFNVIGFGETSVTGAAGDGGIVTDAVTVPAAFSTATISVQNVPEPGTTVLSCIGLGVIALRSRRR